MLKETMWPVLHIGLINHTDGVQIKGKTNKVYIQKHLRYVFSIDISVYIHTEVPTRWKSCFTLGHLDLDGYGNQFWFYEVSTQ